jgi:hypothetical protein
MGNACKGLREFELSRSHYSQAVALFRKAYGTDNHCDIALAVGNLGLVHKD